MDTREDDRGSEGGLPRNFQDEYVEKFMASHLGFDPDRAGYDTIGNVEISYNKDDVEINYSLDDISRFDDEDKILVPMLARADKNIIEKTLEDGLIASRVSVEREDGNINIGFRYSQDDWLTGTEEVGDTILTFEEEADLESYSGL